MWTQPHDADQPKHPMETEQPTTLISPPPSSFPIEDGGEGDFEAPAMSGPKRHSGLSQSARPLLLKQRSLLPDTERDEAWTRRKGLHCSRNGQLRRSVSNEDLDELRGCLDLGFFGLDADSPGPEKLSRTFPALDLYCAINRSFSSDSSSPSPSASESPVSILSPGDDTPELVKVRLKQWAQVVACSLRQRY